MIPVIHTLAHENKGEVKQTSIKHRIYSEIEFVCLLSVFSVINRYKMYGLLDQHYLVMLPML